MKARCQECGSTKDLRSLHGPCGRCAFQKRSAAFLDEVYAIHLEKNAGLGAAGKFVASVPGRAAKAVTGLPGTVQGMASNVGQASAAMLRPAHSFKEGWNATWNPGGKPLHPAYKALMGLGLYQGLKNVQPETDPTGRGHSRLRRAAKLVGDQAGGIIGAPFGFSGGTFASLVGGKAGDMAGAALDKLRGYRPPAVLHPYLPPRPTGLGEEAVHR